MLGHSPDVTCCNRTQLVLVTNNQRLTEATDGTNMQHMCTSDLEVSHNIGAGENRKNQVQYML